MRGNNLKIKFEFTPPKSPQYNGKVERKFATLFARLRSMMNTAGMEGDMRTGLWAEAAQMATVIENTIVTVNKPNPASKKIQKLNNKLRLHVFGEMAIIANRDKIVSKLANRGKPCVYVGPAVDHSGDVFRFFNPETSRII